MDPPPLKKARSSVAEDSDSDDDFLMTQPDFLSQIDSQVAALLAKGNQSTRNIIPVKPGASTADLCLAAPSSSNQEPTRTALLDNQNIAPPGDVSAQDAIREGELSNLRNKVVDLQKQLFEHRRQMANTSNAHYIELDTVKKTSESSEGQLKTQIAFLQQEKRELEGRLRSVTLNTSAVNASQSTLKDSPPQSQFIPLSQKHRRSPRFSGSQSRNHFPIADEFYDKAASQDQGPQFKVPKTEPKDHPSPLRQPEAEQRLPKQSPSSQSTDLDSSEGRVDVQRRVPRERPRLRLSMEMTRPVIPSKNSNVVPARHVIKQFDDLTASVMETGEAEDIPMSQVGPSQCTPSERKVIIQVRTLKKKLNAPMLLCLKSLLEFAENCPLTRRYCRSFDVDHMDNSTFDPSAPFLMKLGWLLELALKSDKDDELSSSDIVETVLKIAVALLSDAERAELSSVYKWAVVFRRTLHAILTGTAPPRSHLKLICSLLRALAPVAETVDLLLADCSPCILCVVCRSLIRERLSCASVQDVLCFIAMVCRQDAAKFANCDGLCQPLSLCLLEAERILGRTADVDSLNTVQPVTSCDIHSLSIALGASASLISGDLVTMTEDQCIRLHQLVKRVWKLVVPFFGSPDDLPLAGEYPNDWSHIPPDTSVKSTSEHQARVLEIANASICSAVRKHGDEKSEEGCSADSNQPDGLPQ